MLRMELACFMVIAFMAILFFSAKREKTKLHQIFSTYLIISMVHLVLDATTVCTVNHLEEIPMFINDIVHKCFIGTMVVLFYLIYRYVVALVEEEIGEEIKLSVISPVIMIITLIGTIFLPIRYMETELGNYSYGLAAYMTYISIAIYLIMVIRVMIKYWKQVHPKRKLVITLAMSIEVGVSLYQAVSPLALLSGMGIMLIGLSFYLLMENPDIRLVDQIKKEKQKAEDANAAKSIFLSQMSHEIRTPMNSIVGMTDVLLRTDLDEEQQEYLSNIKISGNALVTMINDILDISKIEAGKMELTETIYDLHMELDNIRMIIRNRIGEKPIELLYDIDSEIPRILYGDGIRIRQVVINLLNNAVKFTDVGSVQLSLKRVSQTEEYVEILVSIKDTGIGIKEEDLGKLFGAYEQLDRKRNAGKEGSGLGLSISSQIIELMGGKLQVRSEYGTGSEFYFTIRQGVVAEEDYPVEEAEPEYIAPGARILVVDDDYMNRVVVAKLLEPLELQLEVVDSAKKAIELIQKTEYNIVFMDHMMPVMDGVEATSIIRELDGEYFGKVPIVALTANAMKEAEQLFMDVGMNDILIKPIEVKKMNQMIRKWLPEELIQVKTVADNQAPKTKNLEMQKTPFSNKSAEIDMEEGLKYSGTEALFYELLGDFYVLIDTKTNKIRKCMEDNLIKDYTIEVHALKNSARLIGASELSKQFEHLEMLGKQEDVEAIKNCTEEVLEFFQSYKEVLKPYGKQLMQNKNDASLEEMTECLMAIHEGIEGFDLDTADAAMGQLETIKLPEECDSLMEELRVYMADVAMEDILLVTEKMMKVLKDLQ
ncbi:MAG: response regulator [Lachnospiraceae bacterium]|nr:response regulator [Lachnospiraceae bacterium]